MAGSASGPTSLLHSADCPGCAADRTLSALDKAFLDAHGWKHPGHTILPPPDPDPPRYRSHQEATHLPLRRLLPVALGLFVAGAGSQPPGPWFALILLAWAVTRVHHCVARRP